MLRVEGLSVRRGDSLALERLSFTLQTGTLTALVGPNGAGKSTLLQAIEGQLPLAAGTIALEGEPLTPALARRQLALMPQRLEVMGSLRDAGLTLLVSSHDWGADLDAYDRVLVLDRQLLADGTPQQVRQALGDLRVGHHCCG